MLDFMPDDPPDHDEFEIPDKAQEAFNEAFLRSAPGVQLKEAFEAVFDLKAVMAGDEAAASAIRIFQAIAVAVKRKDAVARRALSAWERTTFKYMRKHALDEYLKLPVPPRANLDRKFILDHLKDQIAELLREQATPDTRLTPEVFAITVGAQIHVAFMSHKVPDEDPEHPRLGVAKHLMTELEKHRFRYEKIDAEEMLRVGLQSNLGISSKTAQDWMRRRK